MSFKGRPVVKLQFYVFTMQIASALHFMCSSMSCSTKNLQNGTIYIIVNEYESVFFLALPVVKLQFYDFETWVNSVSYSYVLLKNVPK